jgi:hypothetical protein
MSITLTSTSIDMDFTKNLFQVASSNSNNTDAPRPDTSLECNGVNVTNTHALDRTIQTSYYDPTIRFPIIDIITFWPNRSDTSVYVSTWAQDVHVEVACLRPDQVAQGSAVPPPGKALLEDATFAVESGVGKVGIGDAFVWASLGVVGVMLGL